jgi:hypothetical protein
MCSFVEWVRTCSSMGTGTRRWYKVHFASNKSTAYSLLLPLLHYCIAATSPLLHCCHFSTTALLQNVFALVLMHP